MRHRIEAALGAALACAEEGAPPSLASAFGYAVFPGGARVRPRLCLAVAEACGDGAPEAADAAAVSLELLHAASLVHDDLPCFDDAALRRGKPSVHQVYGEALALLVGDGLIVLAFEALARAAARAPLLAGPLVAELSRAGGAPFGIVAGQAWETEPAVSLESYHRAKTSSLFIAAARMGAIAAGRDPAPWTRMGEKIGEAYQVADDLLDALATLEEAGKPVGQDVAHARPSAVSRLGVEGALSHLNELVADAIEAVPACPGRASLQALVTHLAARLVPAGLKLTAA